MEQKNDAKRENLLESILRNSKELKYIGMKQVEGASIPMYVFKKRSYSGMELAEEFQKYRRN